MELPGRGKPRETEMPFFEHLEELRWHIIRSIIAVGVFSLVAFASKSIIFDTLIFGPTKGNFPTYRVLCWISDKLSLGGMLCIEGVSFKFINIELSGQFMMHLQTSLVMGFVIAFPYVFYEFWRFVKPGLYESEVTHTRGIIFFSSLLFLIGLAFGYYVLTPFALNFFGNYQVTKLVANNFTLTNYVGFLTMFVLSSGIVFELPMVVYFLSKVGLLTPEIMREYRRHAIVVVLILAAFITPADVGTQLLVFVPVYILYEVSIFISARVAKDLEKQMQ